MNKKVVIAHIAACAIMVASLFVDAPIENLAAAIVVAFSMMLIEIAIIMMIFIGAGKKSSTVTISGKWSAASVACLLCTSAMLAVVGMKYLAMIYVTAYVASPLKTQNIET